MNRACLLFVVSAMLALVGCKTECPSEDCVGTNGDCMTCPSPYTCNSGGTCSSVVNGVACCTGLSLPIIPVRKQLEQPHHQQEDEESRLQLVRQVDGGGGGGSGCGCGTECNSNGICCPRGYYGCSGYCYTTYNNALSAGCSGVTTCCP